MSEAPFRHSFEELRAIIRLPLAEVVIVGDAPTIGRLRELMQASELVSRLASAWSEDTRLVVGSGPVLARQLAEQPPGRTCVVLDVAGELDPAPLPVPEMCLRGRLALGPDGALGADLYPEATTVPEALELVAELFFGLGVELHQRPA